ncbi:MAG: hypothetical protein JST42_22015 [Bacteroidetes bacterium]|nr:hypothetical protein [Bacteroidota bacterium]
MNLGENQAALLKKIEELTLYILQQQEDVKQLAAQSKKMAATIEEKSGK